MTKQERINESVQKNRNEKSEFLNRIKEKYGCSKCGETRFYILDFHHIDPRQKEFGLSHSVQKNYAYPRIVHEINKCIILCSNCHREFHYLNGVDAGEESLKQYLGEISPLKEEVPLFESKISAPKTRCCDCGKPISITSTRCHSCASKLKITEKPITRDELKAKIRLQSFVSIGKEFSVTDNAIRKWCRAYELPTSKKLIKSYTNEEWERI